MITRLTLLYQKEEYFNTTQFINSKFQTLINLISFSNKDYEEIIDYHQIFHLSNSYEESLNIFNKHTDIVHNIAGLFFYGTKINHNSGIIVNYKSISEYCLKNNPLYPVFIYADKKLRYLFYNPEEQNYHIVSPDIYAYFYFLAGKNYWGKAELIKFFNIYKNLSNIEKSIFHQFKIRNSKFFYAAQIFHKIEIKQAKIEILESLDNISLKNHNDSKKKL